MALAFFEAVALQLASIEPEKTEHLWLCLNRFFPGKKKKRERNRKRQRKRRKTGRRKKGKNRQEDGKERKVKGEGRLGRKRKNFSRQDFHRRASGDS